MAQDMTRILLHKGDLFLFQLLMMDKSLDMSLTSSVGALHSAEEEEENESLTEIATVVFSPVWDLYCRKINNLMLCQQLAERGYLDLPDLCTLMLHVHINPM